MLNLTGRTTGTRQPTAVGFDQNQPIFFEALSGLKVVRRPISSQCATFTVQMTLGADRFATIDIEVRWIDNRIVGQITRYPCRNMFSARAMTAFATDRFFEKRRFAKTICLVADEIGPARMTRDATTGDSSFKAKMRFRKIIGRQSPFVFL